MLTALILLFIFRKVAQKYKSTMKKNLPGSLGVPVKHGEEEMPVQSLQYQRQSALMSFSILLVGLGIVASAGVTLYQSMHTPDNAPRIEVNIPPDISVHLLPIPQSVAALVEATTTITTTTKK